MAILNFKKGLYSALPTTYNEGTVYVTTDEQAMYVDISGDKRIRLGQIVTFSTLAEFNEKVNGNPPYSDQAFYYIVDKNALVRWVNADEDNPDGFTGNWTQINSTSALEASLTTQITKAQATADNAVTAAGTAQSTADQAVKDAATAQAAAEAADANADTRVLKTDFESFKTDNTTAIAAAKKAGDDAQSTADTAVSDAATAQAAAEKAQSTADSKAPIDHASEATTYGVGSSTKYGHVKLSDAVTSDSGVSGGVAATPAAVKSAKDAADAAVNAAKTAQDTADANATSITTINNNIATIQGDITEIKSDISENADAIKDLQDAVGTGTGANTLSGRVSALETRASEIEAQNKSQDTEISNLSATVTSNKSATDTAIETINTTIGSSSDDSIANTVYGYINKQKAASDSALASAKSELQTAIDAKASQTDLDSLTTTVNGKASSEDLEKAESNLTNLINNKINAANAMTYIGTVGTKEALPTSNVSVGDTYVATADMTVGGDSVYAGDLLIAKGTEKDDIIVSDLAWDVVATGYNATKDPKLTVANNTVTLKNAADGSLGAVTFAGNGLNVSTSGTTVTYAIEWGSF